MGDSILKTIRPPFWCYAPAVVVLALAGTGLVVRSASPADRRPESDEATSEQVHQLCGSCHAYPPPDTFPRFAWRKEVKQGYDFFHNDPSLRFDYPPLESVVRYYERRAPEALPQLARPTPSKPPPVQFERRGLRPPGNPRLSGVTHVSLARLSEQRRPEILVCDALAKQVVALAPDGQSPGGRVLAEGLCCAHAEVADVDGDGIPDVVLACLGNYYATNDRVGSVVWLKGSANGTFTPITLLDGIGRVADVRVADFTGDGKPDLVVAAFGWRLTGETLLLENQTTDWSRPTFVPRVLDARRGASHIAVADLNRDGKPDFVTLISQDHETVVAFLNEGNGRFRKETIYAAPHPSFGCNGLQLIDLDGDGDLDVLLSNGDALDAPYLLKPYHGVQWLENRGTFPFTHHRLTDMYGAGSPVAIDVDGDGDLDVVAVCFLPPEYFPQRAKLQLDSLVLLEQVAPGKFVHHALEAAACDHLACAVGDVDGDGRPSLIVGNFVRGGRPGDAVGIWKPVAGK